MFTEEEVGEELQRRLEPRPNDFARTETGYTRFINSPAMVHLYAGDPGQYERYATAFLTELAAEQEVNPVEISKCVERIRCRSRVAAALPKGAMAKALKTHLHATAAPRPWDFPRTDDGLQQFLNSEEMRALETADLAAWRHYHCEFFASLPNVFPMDVSRKRLQLENAPPSFGKSVGADRSHLTHGQNILVQNFGVRLGDPGQWLKSR